MAHRPIEAKRAKRLRRSLTKGTLPRYIDLIQWIKLRVRCTTGMAQKIILAEALVVDSHPIGFNRWGDKKTLATRVPVERVGEGGKNIVIKDIPA